MNTFGFDNEYDFDYEYEFLVRPKSRQEFENCCRSNFVTVLQFSTKIAEGLMVNITSSKAKKKLNSRSSLEVKVSCTSCNGVNSLLSRIRHLFMNFAPGRGSAW